MSAGGKKQDADVFDELSTSTLNAYLKELMPGLTAKVSCGCFPAVPVCLSVSLALALALSLALPLSLSLYQHRSIHAFRISFRVALPNYLALELGKGCASMCYQYSHVNMGREGVHK